MNVLKTWCNSQYLITLQSVQNCIHENWWFYISIKKIHFQNPYLNISFYATLKIWNNAIHLFVLLLEMSVLSKQAPSMKCWSKSPGQVTESTPWKYLEGEQTWCLRTWFSCGIGNVRFVTIRVYSKLDDSMIPWSILKNREEDDPVDCLHLNSSPFTTLLVLK